jgi:hypothetical protein
VHCGNSENARKVQFVRSFSWIFPYLPLDQLLTRGWRYFSNVTYMQIHSVLIMSTAEVMYLFVFPDGTSIHKVPHSQQKWKTWRPIDVASVVWIYTCFNEFVFAEAVSRSILGSQGKRPLLYNLRSIPTWLFVPEVTAAIESHTTCHSIKQPHQSRIIIESRVNHPQPRVGADNTDKKDSVNRNVGAH